MHDLDDTALDTSNQLHMPLPLQMAMGYRISDKPLRIHGHRHRRRPVDGLSRGRLDAAQLQAVGLGENYPGGHLRRAGQ